MRIVLLLLGGSLLLWAALLYPGWLWWGETALIHSATAWLLCVPAGVAVTAWALRRDHEPNMRVIAVLGGSGVRLAAALGGGLALTHLLPETFTRVFWLWVGVFYLVLLTSEVLLLLRFQDNKPSAGSTPQVRA